MKKMFIVMAFALLLFSSPAIADDWVNGYTKSDGTYVAPHRRSSSDNSTFNNWSTKDNYNPYTGQKGYKDPYKPKTYKRYRGY